MEYKRQIIERRIDLERNQLVCGDDRNRSSWTTVWLIRSYLMQFEVWGYLCATFSMNCWYPRYRPGFLNGLMNTTILEVPLFPQSNTIVFLGCEPIKQIFPPAMIYTMVTTTHLGICDTPPVMKGMGQSPDDCTWHAATGSVCCLLPKKKEMIHALCMRTNKLWLSWAGYPTTTRNIAEVVVSRFDTCATQQIIKSSKFATYWKAEV